MSASQVPVIGIDASRMAGFIRTGTENYSDRIIRGLLNEDVPWRWRLYVNGTSDQLDLPESDRVEVRDIPARRLWTHMRLSRETMQHPPTGLFVPSHVIPFVHPPSVVTIHDLGYIHVPEAHPPRQRRMLDLTTRWSAAQARHIIVPSQATADDLVREYRTPADKITVIPHGVDPRFQPTNPEAIAATKARLSLPDRFVLSVGTIQPRKNLPLLAEAMRHIPDDVHLVIAGKRGWMADDVLAGINAAGLGKRLHILDYVPDESLPALYAAADVYTQPSRFEGFGMPVLEAMAAGVAVVTNRGSCLAEVGGDAAVYYEQDNAESLASAITSLLTDAALRHRHVTAGLSWARTFTWERAASQTRAVLERTLVP